MPLSRFSAFAALCAAAGLASLAANPFEWTGLGGTNWSNSANWLPGPLVGGVDTAIVFDNTTQLVSTLDLAGGLVLNSLTFGPNSGVRGIGGTQPLIFAGTNPTLTMQNTVGSGSTVIGVPVQLQSTLTVNGGLSFDRQFVLNSAAPISGNGGITLASGLFATNSTQNTFTGPVLIQGGLYGANTAAGFGNAPSVTIESGGSIQLFGANSTFSVNRSLFLAGSGAQLQGAYALAASGAGTKSWSGAITLTGDARVQAFGGAVLNLSGPIALEGHTLTATGSGNANDRVLISGVVSGEGDIVANSSTAGRGVALSGTSVSTFVGDVRIVAGRLDIANDNRLGASANVVTLDGGTLGAFTTALGQTVVVPASRSVVIGPNGGTFQGDRPNFGVLSVQTVLSGENPIGVRDSVVFGAANTFTGPLTIHPGGGLSISADANLGATSSVLRLAGTADNVATAASLTLTAPVTLSADRTIDLVGARNNLVAQANSRVESSIVGPGEIRFFASGANTVLTVAGQTSHTGGTVIDGDGTVAADSAARLAPAGSAVQHASGRLRALADLQFSPDYAYSLGFSASGPRLDTNGFVVRFEGPIAHIPEFGTGRLFKEGAGTLLLDGDSTYTGLTDVLGGKLGGRGGVAGNVAIRTGATLAPGSATEFGQFDIGGTLTFFDGSFAVKLGGTERGVSYDSVAVTSNVSAAGNTLGITLVNGFEGSIASTDTFVIMTYNQFVSGTFLNILGGRVDTADGLGSFAVTIGPNSMILSDYIGVIPEPATAAALLGLAALAAVAWRRRGRDANTSSVE